MKFLLYRWKFLYNETYKIIFFYLLINFLVQLLEIFFINLLCFSSTKKISEIYFRKKKLLFEA